jgi:hypothetical protein
MPAPPPPVSPPLSDWKTKTVLSQRPAALSADVMLPTPSSSAVRHAMILSLHQSEECVMNTNVDERVKVARESALRVEKVKD